MTSIAISGKALIGFMGGSVPELAAVSGTPLFALTAEDRVDRGLDLGDRNGWPLTLLSGRASTRNWSRSTVLSWPVFISGTRICSNAASSDAEILRQRPDVADVDVADVERPCAARGAPPGGSGRRSSPSRRRQACRWPRRGRRPGRESSMPSILAARMSVIAWWLAGRIIDVAGAERLLDPADAVHQAGRAGLDPWPRKLRVAGVGHAPPSPFGRLVRGS